MKRELYARLARAAADKRRDPDTLREEVAKRYHLKVVSGRIPIHVGEMKTEASQKPVPMDGTLAAVLQHGSTPTWYCQPDDWVFASSNMHGTQPYWPEMLLRCYVQPAARRVGIRKSKSAGTRSVEPLQRF